MRAALALLAMMTSVSIAAAAIQPSPTAPRDAAAAPAKAQQVAGSYQGKKYCYTRGSATICN